MPKVSFLVAASPTTAFYSQISALNMALKALPWRKWEPSICVAMGWPDLTQAEDDFDAWSPHLQEVAFSRVSQASYEYMGNWAQCDDVLRMAPRDADVLVQLDADVLPVAGVEGILDEVLARRAIAGVMAHFAPPGWKGVDDWKVCANDIAHVEIDCSNTYSLVKGDAPAEHRSAPLYFNGGVVLFESGCYGNFIHSYLDMRGRLVDRIEYADFSAQIAMALSIAKARLPSYALDMRYNYPNDDLAMALHPGELEEVVFFHYLRRNAFDRQKIFGSRGEYDRFLGASLQNTNHAFREHVRRIMGGAYPFGANTPPSMP